MDFDFDMVEDYRFDGEDDDDCCFDGDEESANVDDIT